MEKFLHRGLELEYEDKGTGIPLIFLHGMGGSIEQIRNLYEPLKNVRIIVPNQEGHGNSEANWELYDFNQLADDMIALLQHLSIDKAYFAGISMGAAVCLNIAVRYADKVKGLMLIRNAWTNKPMSKKVQLAYKDMGKCLKKGGEEAFKKTEGFEIVNVESNYTKNAFSSPFTDPSCLKYWEKYLILPSKVPVQSEDDLKKISIPTTIIANHNDLCHPFEYGEYLYGMIKNSRFVEIPDKDSDKILHNQMINREISWMVRDTK